MTIDLRVRPRGNGATVSLEASGGRALLGRPVEEQHLGWLAEEVVGPVLLRTAPSAMAAWQMDRTGRRPSGRSGRAQYAEPIYHFPNFSAILERLNLSPSDRLLEVGCGGGAFLKQALRSGCRAAAVDHSADLLEVASNQNRSAIEAGRLRLEYGDAARLPFARDSFTCAVMTGVLPWLPHPVPVFREIRRTLKDGGRFVAYSGTPKMYGTPAAGPRVPGGVHLYESAEVIRMARQAGFVQVRVENPDLTGFAKAYKVPKAAMFLFQAPYNQILTCRKPARRSRETRSVQSKRR